jgi:hypothetical protein
MGRENISLEGVVQRTARSAGAQGSTSEKTAEAVGERVGNAYSDAGSIAQKKKGNLGTSAKGAVQ